MPQKKKHTHKKKTILARLDSYSIPPVISILIAILLPLLIFGAWMVSNIYLDQKHSSENQISTFNQVKLKCGHDPIVVLKSSTGLGTSEYEL